MRVIVVGAGGRTGRRVVEEALLAGHRVTAAVRHPDRFPAPRVPAEPAAGLRVVRADVRDADALRAAFEGQDVVVSAVGTPGRRSEQLYSEGARATVAAMERCGVERLLAVSSAGVRYDDRELALWYRWLVRPLIADLYADMICMERIVRASSLRWTFVRPVLLLDREPTDTYRVGDAATPARGRTITCADVARFVVGEIDDPRWSGRAPTLAQ